MKVDVEMELRRVKEEVNRTRMMAMERIWRMSKWRTTNRRRKSDPEVEMELSRDVIGLSVEKEVPWAASVERNKMRRTRTGHVKLELGRVVPVIDVRRLEGWTRRVKREGNPDELKGVAFIAKRPLLLVFQ